jgi:lipopolysaccharide transport system permease protein
MNSDTEIIIEPGRGIKRYWKDLWHYRELFYFLAWRDILVRYKQTVIGIAWSVVRPLLTMVVFTVVFGRLAKLPSDGVPYPIMVYAAMLPWQLFANSLSDSSNSLVSNTNLITKVFFPKIIMPASSVLTSLLDFVISSCILVLLMVWYKFMPDWRIIAIPIFLCLALVTSFGFGLWLAALNVKYRDFKYIVPFIVQLGLYISPVGFSSSIIPDNWRFIYSLNPMVGVIDGFRWAILGGESQLYMPGLVVSFFLAAGIFGGGFVFFRKTERTFADVI